MVPTYENSGVPIFKACVFQWSSVWRFPLFKAFQLGVFSFSFVMSKVWLNFSQTLANLIEFTLGNFSTFFSKKMKKKVGKTNIHDGHHLTLSKLFYIP
jgi:hypothetical protein